MFLLQFASSGGQALHWFTDWWRFQSRLCFANRVLALSESSNVHWQPTHEGIGLNTILKRYYTGFIHIQTHFRDSVWSCAPTSVVWNFTVSSRNHPKFTLHSIVKVVEADYMTLQARWNCEIVFGWNRLTLYTISPHVSSVFAPRV